MKTRTTMKPQRLDRQARERQLVDTLAGMVEANGYSPTLRELARSMGLSLTRIAQLMESCQEQGLVSGAPGIARTWRVVRPAADDGER